MQTELWILLRLLVAAALSGLIGYEREKTGKRAGLRTHILVAVGSTLFVSSYDLALAEARKIAANELVSVVQLQIPVLAAVQAVATGIGFLGAGTIFVGSRRARVYGLTTAASIWTTAAIGMAIAFDRFVLAIGCTVLVLFVLHVLLRFEPPDPPVDNDPTSDPPAPGKS